MELRGGGWSWVEVGAQFSNNHLITPFKMTINHFFFNSSFCSQDFFISQARVQRNFHFLYQDDARNIERGNWVRQIARNGKKYNIHFKSNFNRLVRNVTQINFLY